MRCRERGARRSLEVEHAGGRRGLAPMQAPVGLLREEE